MGPTRVLAAFVASVALFAVVARRSLDHPSPVIDPAMLRIRGFAIAVVASLIFFVGFAAMLLSGVLFMTGVWGEDLLAGPDARSRPGDGGDVQHPVGATGRPHRLPRAPACSGRAVRARRGVVADARGRHARLRRRLLPGMLVSGIGVGLLLPTLTGAGAASLPAARFSTGIAVVTMGRQIGSALGVAVLVALLGTPAPWRGARRLPATAGRSRSSRRCSAPLAGLAIGVAGPAVSPLPAVPRGTAAGTQPG